MSIHASPSHRSTLVIALLVGLAAFLAWQSFTSATPSTASPEVAAATDVPTARQRPAGLDSDGEVPDGVTVFDDLPAVTKLDPDLLGALRRAASDAARDGITFYVNSGWRSRAYQDRLLSDAIAKYGSKAEAARWVATADTSPHVSGQAADIGRTDAMSWLSQHGAAYGLCQVYGNEPWHYELRPDAPTRGCPAAYADPTHDPRMQ